MSTSFVEKLSHAEPQSRNETCSEWLGSDPDNNATPLSGTRKLLPFPEQEMDFAELEAILDES